MVCPVRTKQSSIHRAQFGCRGVALAGVASRLIDQSFLLLFGILGVVVQEIQARATNETQTTKKKKRYGTP